MSDEVIFEDDPDLVGNMAIVRGAPKGMLAWLVKKEIVKNAHQAEQFLLWVTIGAVILMVCTWIFMLATGSVPRVPLGSDANSIIAQHIKALKNP